ncbi:MAG: TIGR00730 family Rossman fold protein [Candidatus Eremiobacteraeota bacterium]|nr:TIGR00730 family Rossman fold protein [Candidatus Eremiobacteraeota bacterium]
MTVPFRICVFCGSNDGNRPLYRRTAAHVARLLVARGIGIVYGGGRVGCMGTLADAALAQGGEVIGIIPRALEEREVAHHGLTELHVVETMHERKALMAASASAFLTLAGGFGTLEEMFEAITWRQLGYHDKPSAVLNTDGYFDGLLAFCDTARDEGFVKPQDRAVLIAGREPAEVLDILIARSTQHR